MRFGVWLGHGKEARNWLRTPDPTISYLLIAGRPRGFVWLVDPLDGVLAFTKLGIDGGYLNAYPQRIEKLG
ncbi:hypothetical protein Tco_1041636 [Tanacetum coccineum]|uniref:Uncharacterized protein n=1 Tax=Tanacetum coccineum TaxID=301880 RepID=A0ABQ5GGQ3_9ASTR